MVNVRLFFSKTGDARYLSHLDLMRCFSRAVRRSGLKVWYTEGFNTHIYLMFSNPLSLGYESECETVDFRLLDDAEMEKDIPALINRGLPAGIKVERASEAVMKHTDIEYSRWLITIPLGGTDPDKARELMSGFFSQPSVMVLKKTKRGETTEDALPFVRKAEWETEGGSLVLDAVICSGTQKSLNPRLLLSAFTEYSGIDTELALVRRTDNLTGSMASFR